MVIVVFCTMKILWWAGFSFLPIVFMFLWPACIPAVLLTMAILNLFYNLHEGDAPPKSRKRNHHTTSIDLAISAG